MTICAGSLYFVHINLLVNFPGSNLLISVTLFVLFICMLSRLLTSFLLFPSGHCFDCRSINFHMSICSFASISL